MDYLSPLRSELKLKILLSLLNGEKKVAELKNEVETRDTTILHALEELCDLDLTTKTQKGNYRLSSLGLIEAKIFKSYLLNSQVIEKFKEFWLSHNVTDIPPRLLLNIGALNNASLVKTQASELGIVHKTFLKTIKKCKKIRGISPIFHPDFIALFGQLLDQGCTIELIVSSDVIDKIMNNVDIEIFQKHIVSGTLKILLNDNVKIALALTENSFSLGLFALSGIYDDSTDLLSNNTQALEWGEQLFEEVAKNSKKMGSD